MLTERATRTARRTGRRPGRGGRRPRAAAGASRRRRHGAAGPAALAPAGRRATGRIRRHPQPCCASSCDTRSRAPVPRRARGWCARPCSPTVGERRPSELLDAILLVTSELVTNGLRHGEPPVLLTVDRIGARLRLTVTDRGLEDPASAPGRARNPPEAADFSWFPRWPPPGRSSRTATSGSGRAGHVGLGRVRALSGALSRAAHRLLRAHWLKLVGTTGKVWGARFRRRVVRPPHHRGRGLLAGRARRAQSRAGHAASASCSRRATRPRPSAPSSPSCARLARDRAGRSDPGGRLRLDRRHRRGGARRRRRGRSARTRCCRSSATARARVRRCGSRSPRPRVT